MGFLYLLQGSGNTMQMEQPEDRKGDCETPFSGHDMATTLTDSWWQLSAWDLPRTGPVNSGTVLNGS